MDGGNGAAGVSLCIDIGIPLEGDEESKLASNDRSLSLNVSNSIIMFSVRSSLSIAPFYNKV